MSDFSESEQSIEVYSSDHQTKPYEYEDLKSRVLDIFEFNKDVREREYALEQLCAPKSQLDEVLAEITSSTASGPSGATSFVLSAAELFRSSIIKRLPDKFERETPLVDSEAYKEIYADYNAMNLLHSIAALEDNRDKSLDELTECVDFRERYEEIRLVVSDYFAKRSENVVRSHPDIFDGIDRAVKGRFMKLIYMLINQNDIGNIPAADDIDSIQNFLIEDSLSYWMDRESWLGDKSAVAPTSIKNDRDGKADSVATIEGLDRRAILVDFDYTTGRRKTLLKKLSRNLDPHYREEAHSLPEPVIVGDRLFGSNTPTTPLIFCVDKDHRDVINEQTWNAFSYGSDSLHSPKDLDDERLYLAYLMLEEVVLQLEYYKKYNIHTSDLDQLLDHFKARRDQVKELIESPRKVLKSCKSYCELAKLLQKSPDNIHNEYESVK